MASSEAGTRDGGTKPPHHATVVAWLALFIALGGVASGLPGSSNVGPDDIRDGAVRSLELRNATVKRADIATNAITTPAIADGAVSPLKIGPTPAARVFIPQQAPGCTSQVIEDGPAEVLQFSVEEFDTQSLHAAPPVDCAAGMQSRLTAPVDGIYAVSAEITWPSDPDGHRSLSLLKTDIGGSTAVANDLTSAISGAGTQQAVSTLADLNSGEFVEIEASHTSGDPLTLGASIDTYLAMAWIGPAPE